MDRSNRRRQLGVVAIVVGALASAGTSPSPTATPELSSSQEGILTVTAEEPVAWIDVSAIDDANLIDAEAQTAIRLEATSRGDGVFLIIEEVGGVNRTQGEYASLTAFCETGRPCQAEIRLIAILVDPVRHPSVEVEYTAIAEARFPGSEGPVPTATLEVDVSDVQSRSAAAVGLATTEREEVHVGPDVPRAVRTVHVSLPAGPPEDPILRPNALVVANEVGHGAGFHPNVLVTSLADGTDVDLPWADVSSPLADCEVGAPCETELELQFNWNGGAAEGSSIEWSLVVWPGVGTEGPRPAATVDSPVPADVSWDGPTLTSSTRGQASLAPNRGASVNLNATLDLSDVPQRAGNVEGLLRLTFRATLAPGTDSAARVRLSLDGSELELAGAGETKTAYSRAIDLVCGGRSTCPANATFSIGLSPVSGNLPEATVDWAAEVEFLPLSSAEVPAGARLDVVVPSPPP